ncbi:MAG: Bcr/CflA family efflux MFS transporter [Gammaproteobacteria bacterium]|nr:Bcr/CflA family efflux MFS transporter [Gammaproteobacteria bacterium]
MNKRIIVFVLVLASSLTMMSTDIYAPSLAHLPDFFSTSAENIKLTMSLNAAAYALATLFHGPLSERFGRKPVLLWGMIGFTFFSLCCAMAQTVEQLIVARVFQGISAAVEGVLVLAIIRDLFDEIEQVKVIGLYGVASCVSPAAAPIIGGYVHVLFGWRMNFHLLFICGLLVTAAVWYFLEESSKKNVASLSPKAILSDYWGLLCNGLYMKYCIIAGSSLGVFFAFITAGPFILINNHGLATEHFGYFQAIMVAGFALGAFYANYMVKKIGIKAIMNTGFAILVVGAIIILGLTYNANDGIVSLAIGMTIIALADGLIFSTTPTLAMQASTSRTGSAAAMLVTMEVGTGALAALSVGVLHDGSSRPLGLTVAALVFAGLLSYLLKQKKEEELSIP